MARNEPLFLPIWYKYYSGLFGSDNLYIIDHASTHPTPGQTLEPLTGSQMVNIVRLPDSSDSDEASLLHHDQTRFGFLSAFMRGLLHYYDVVIHNDADEVFIVDPLAGATLKEYLEHRGAFEVLAGIGIELLHDHVSERAIVPDQPILAQRRKFVYRIHHSKPHILRKAARIRAHGADRIFSVEPEIFLLHLKFIDRDYLINRQRFLRQLWARGAGKLSRWQMTEGDIAEELDRLLSFKDADPNFVDHHEIALRQPRMNPKRGVFELNGAFQQAERERIQSRINYLPDRFIGLL